MLVNRTLIRSKVLQVMYSYMLTRPEKTVAQAHKELNTCLDKSYELYHYLLRLPVELTHLQEIRLDEARNKYLPTPEELNPNMKFVNNRLVKALAENETLNQFVNDKTITWNDDPIFMKLMLDKVLRSDIYNNYMASDEDDMAADSALWQQLLKQVIVVDDNMLEQIELKSVYWNSDDLDLTTQFVCKTMRRFADGGPEPLVLPMYKNEEDSQFAEKLFLGTIQQMDENNQLIDKQLEGSRWDASRLVLMDRLILCQALTEVREFEKIPLAVTLNEYIELAKSFSTAQSGAFVNAILNNAAVELKRQGVIAKTGETSIKS